MIDASIGGPARTARPEDHIMPTKGPETPTRVFDANTTQLAEQGSVK